MEAQAGSFENDKAMIEGVYDFALRIMAHFANVTAEAACRRSDEGFCEDAEKAIESARTATAMRDPTFWKRVIELPNELRLNLGFRYWDAESMAQGKMLVPFWIYALLSMDFEAGGKKRRDVNDYTRFGCVFWLV